VSNRHAAAFTKVLNTVALQPFPGSGHAKATAKWRHAQSRCIGPGAVKRDNRRVPTSEMTLTALPATPIYLIPMSLFNSSDLRPLLNLRCLCFNGCGTNGNMSATARHMFLQFKQRSKLFN